MKLFSTALEAVYGMTIIYRSFYVIANDREEAEAKLRSHIEKSPKLGNAEIKSIVIAEEAAIF